MFITISLYDLDIILIIMEDYRHENIIEHIEYNFIKSFKIVFTILSDIIFCDILKSNYKINFYFKKNIRYIPFNEIKLIMKLGIKNN